MKTEDTFDPTTPDGYTVTNDPILPGWPWVLELPSGQLAHFTSEGKAVEYSHWHHNRKEEDS